MAKAPLKYKNLAKLNEKLAELQRLTDTNLAAGNYDLALKYALEAHKMVPATVVPLDRAGVICLRAKRYEEAIGYAKKALNRDPNYVNSLNILAESYYPLGEYEKAREAGLKALELTEQALGNPPPVTLGERGLNPQGKNLVAFSLFGDGLIYLESAVLNSELVHLLYPNWRCRFYIDSSVPQNVVARLKASQAEIVEMNDDEAMPKTMWRFLAADDPEANYVIFRDADSVISVQEAKLVNAWIASGKRFHTIRDYGSHTELILAGLWGMQAGSIPNMAEKIRQFVAQGELHKRFADQHFLRNVVWHYAKQDLCAHDSVFGFGENVQVFDNPYKSQFHIGCRECVNQFVCENAAWQEGDLIEWSLYSRISARLNEDLTPYEIGEERLVCTYRQRVKNGKIMDYLPQRYTKGLQDGLSRIVTTKVEE